MDREERMRPMRIICWWWCLAALLLLAACHDAPRKNPFDPQLTPAVELTVALDDTAGTATLTWTPYMGEQTFSAYWVLRNVAKSIEVDTLALIEEVEQTAFVDSSLAPDTAYEYRVAAVNSAGFVVSSEERGVAGYSVEGVHLLPVESDLQAGALVLHWSRFRGPDFVFYQIRRRLGELIQEEVLATLDSVEDTTFVDSTALTGIDYVYTVDVHAAGETLSSNSLILRLILPGVVLAEPVMDSATASATLSWTPYEGSRFAIYRVERKTAELAWHPVAELDDRRGRSLVNKELLGSTEYFYRVVVVTDRGEEVESREVSGTIHPLVDSWPLELEEESFVRLYVEEEGKLTALVADPGGVRLLFFDLEGDLLEEQELLVLGRSFLKPRSVATAPDGKGGRALVLTLRPRNWPGFTGVLLFDREGQPLRERRALFADAFTEPLRGEHAIVPGFVELLGGSPEVAFDNVAVSQGEALLFADDFEHERLDEWTFMVGSLENGWLTGGEQGNPVLRKEELSWQDFRVEADVSFSSPTWARITTGGSQYRYSRFLFTLEVDSQRAGLSWIFRKRLGSTSAIDDETEIFDEDLTLLPGLPYRMGLECVEGEVGVSLEGPVSPWGVANGDPRWNCAVSVGQESETSLALIAGERPIQLISGEVVARFPYEEEASEVRFWEAGADASRLGVCLPQLNWVLIGKGAFSRLTGRVRWPSDVLERVGVGMGQEAGAFLVPLSLDAGPEGRVYVLDAGNARIQVFDDRGNYITRFGRRGKGAGDFDFGSGYSTEDFSGSIAVDDEGFIYVADVGNRRIQKFAP